MKLKYRRKVRQALLDAPYGTSAAIGIGFLGIVGLGLYFDDLGVMVFGVALLFGFWSIREESQSDMCPTCHSEVDALSTRYCATCGERLDDLPAAPPIDERVDERFTPVGLSELEKRTEPHPVADGGEDDEEPLERADA